MLEYRAPANLQDPKAAQEKLMLELSVLSELKKGAFLATKAIASGDDGERRSLRLDADGAYFKALRMMTESDFPIADSSIQEKLVQLRALLRELT